MLPKANFLNVLRLGGQRDRRKRRAAVERLCAYFEIAVGASAGEFNLRQVTAAVKCLLFDKRYVSGNDHLGDVFAVVKRICADGGDTPRESYIRRLFPWGSKTSFLGDV